MRTFICIGSTLLALCAMGSAAWGQNIFPQTGNVGIGTGSPQKALHIYTEPSDRQIRMEDHYGFWEFWAGGNFHIREDGAVDRLFIAGNTGRVGIGRTNPAEMLHVNGNVLAGAYLIPSDARLKTQVTQLHNALQTLQGIRGVSFTWNDAGRALGHSAATREIGVIAQEVESVLPEVVISTDDGGYKAVDYGRLTSVLVEGIKELQAQKDAEIAKLEIRIETLEQASKRQDASALMSIEGMSGGWPVYSGLLVLVGLGLRRRPRRP